MVGKKSKTANIMSWLVRRCLLLLAFISIPYLIFTMLELDIDDLLTTAIGDYEYDNNQQTTSEIEEMQLAVVGCKGKLKDSVSEALNMVKSAVLFAQSPMHVHIFTDVPDDFKEKLELWPSNLLSKFRYSLKGIDYPLSKEDEKTFHDWWGPCASFRLFLPQVMKDEDAIMYVDSDVLFLGPPDELWQHFKEFNDYQVGALASRAGWDFHVPASNQNYAMDL